jgi:hypothetical protein
MMKQPHTRVERHVYPRTVVSVSLHCKNPAQHVGLVQNGYHVINIKHIFHRKSKLGKLLFVTLLAIEYHQDLKCRYDL